MCLFLILWSMQKAHFLHAPLHAKNRLNNYLALLYSVLIFFPSSARLQVVALQAARKASVSFSRELSVLFKIWHTHTPPQKRTRNNMERCGSPIMSALALWLQTFSAVYRWHTVNAECFIKAVKLELCCVDSLKKHSYKYHSGQDLTCWPMFV